MTQRAGRVSCPKCGANNFETVSACWKCGGALGAGGAMPVAGTMPAPNGYGGPERAYTPSAAPVMASNGDSGVATRAAIALALTFPWIGLPVGWVFMMIEDRRKQAIGRICAVWSLVGLVFHLLLMFVFMQAAVSFMMNMVNLSGTLRGRGGGLEGGSLNGNMNGIDPGSLGGGLRP